MSSCCSAKEKSDCLHGHEGTQHAPFGASLPSSQLALAFQEVLELKAKARLKAKLKSDKELGLIRRDGERHSVPRTSKGTSRFPRHLSLEITQGDVRVCIFFFLH
ncbi:unnamed protein product [Gongylonema pulchrum]|uniref:Stathmin n=1 Tax=Gongylonema pulchrum TaxID=637853 RepID=A0A183EHA0_9BILA|nr:unnamed protein product [Gongylonema pulchrum]